MLSYSACLVIANSLWVPEIALNIKCIFELEFSDCLHRRTFKTSCLTNTIANWLWFLIYGG